MKLRDRHQKRTRRKVMVPIASMGDIAFLLIIFFMVASEFFTQKPIEATVPQWVDMQEVERAKVYVGIDKDGMVVLNRDTDVTPEMITAEVRYWVDRQPANAGSFIVPVRVDKGLTKSVFGPVIEAINEGGGSPLLLAEEKKQGG